MKRFVGLIVNKNREGKGDPVTPIASKYKLIDFPLSNMVNAGAKNIGVVLNNNSRKVSDHLGSGKDWGLERNANGLFLLESEYLTLKNQDASNDLRDLLKNIDFLMNIKEEFVLIAGCNFVANIDYKEIFNDMLKEKADVLLIYKKNELSLKNVNRIVIDGMGKFLDTEFVQEEEIVENLFMETFFIRKEILLSILRTANRSGIFCMNELLSKIKDEIIFSLYEYKGVSFYIDTPKRYFDVNMSFLNQEIYTQIFNNGVRHIYTKNSDYPPTVYGPDAMVTNSLLTSGDQVNGTIKSSVIFRNVKIEKNAVVENCIIGDNCVIEEGVHLKNIILDPDCRISKDTTLLSSQENPMVIS